MKSQNIFYTTSIFLCINQSQCFSHLSFSKRSTWLGLSQVKDLSSYEEYQVDSLIKNYLNEADRAVGVTHSDAIAGADANMLQTVQTAVQSLSGFYQSLSSPSSSQYFSQLQNKVDDVLVQLQPIQTLSDSLAQKVSSLPSTDFLSQIHMNFGGIINHSPVIDAATAGIPTFIITSLIILMALFQSKDTDPISPYPDSRYNATSAKMYFDRRKFAVLSRVVQIATSSSLFLFKILIDYLSNKLEENSDTRAMELSTLLTKLGPSFIKVGQSLSIRTDLLSPAYVRGLKSLQDQVPPFPTEQAIEIIEQELGSPIQDLFSDFSDEPIAAASLGQVYRTKLKFNGQEVAVKVQRPNIMNQIALDMHILREFAPWARKTFKFNTDLADVVDTWAVGFVDELDYISEAENADFFTESIKSTPLSGVVFAPSIVDEYTTGKVLTSEWVVGERLDKSRNEDVTVLCSVAMNSYLTMMLETGVLHCDPHPGNLLRTPDGRLCILDWGMVTRLDPNLQITLIEHVAHLTSGDYAEVPRDLLVLGFIPESKADLITDSGIVEVLADIYSAWTRGGGAAAINVNQVVTQLQDLTAKKGNLFQLPAYFAYIAKAFSVLEGIGLSNNPNYSIVNECLPYVSKRLLTDTSDRTGGALNSFVFGKAKNDEERVIDYKRVKQLVNGFADYSTSASGALLGLNQTRVELIDKLSEQVFDLLVTENETPLQNIMTDQVAKIFLSNTRSLFADLRDRSGTLPSGRSVLGTLIDPIGLFRSSPIVRMSDIDLQTVETTRKLLRLIQEQFEVSGRENLFDFKTLDRAEVQALSNMLIRKMWSRRMSIMKTGNRFFLKVLTVTADKLEKGDRAALSPVSAIKINSI